MTKLGRQISALIILFGSCHAVAQTQYPLHVRGIDKDSASLVDQFSLRTSFSSRTDCITYITKLPGLLQARGYVTASLDSMHFDSAYARIVVYLGSAYQWAKLDPKYMDPLLLSAVGWREKMFMDEPIDFVAVTALQENILRHLENTGHPFAKVYLDSLQLDNNKVSALLKADKGPLYKIDSIRLYGNAKISNAYLQRYLEIPPGSTYNRDKLQRISRKIRDLQYVEEEKPADLTRLGTGSVLNLYLKQRKSSQVNILVGFLPNNDQLSSKKLLLTGEANILLRNAMGNGETIGLNWQQLQVRSPRIHFIYQHPYLLNSPFGLDFAFDMFRKDSTFLNINFQLGAQYVVNANQAGKLFIQRFQTIVNGVNKGFILQNRRLADEADISAINVGLDYEFNNTNNRLNPVRGNELHIITSVGTKKIKKNNEILELKDPGDPGFDFETLYDTVKLKSYQFRARATLAKYFPLGSGQRTTFKTAFNGGMFQSGNVFKNELFQLGGYKLLRGFDEESQYLSQFAVVSFEFRYLVDINAYFYAFLDGGWGRNKTQNQRVDYNYLGAGLGLALETKAGIFNLAWAVGRRNDTEFNLRQSKIHFGFANFF